MPLLRMQGHYWGEHSGIVDPTPATFLQYRDKGGFHPNETMERLSGIRAKAHLGAPNGR